MKITPSITSLENISSKFIKLRNNINNNNSNSN